MEQQLKRIKFGLVCNENVLISGLMGTGKAALAKEALKDKTFIFISYSDLFLSNYSLFESPRQKLSRILESALIDGIKGVIFGHLEELIEEAGLWTALSNSSDGWFKRLNVSCVSIICTVNSNSRALPLIQDHFLHHISVNTLDSCSFRPADLLNVQREAAVLNLDEAFVSDLMKGEGRTCAQIETKTTTTDMTTSTSDNSITLDRFYGLNESIKRTLLEHSSFFFGKLSARGALLSGPPGTGKTRLALALATTLGPKTRLIVLAAADLLRAEVGSSEVKLKEAFKLARASQPSLIFIDEIDSIFPQAPPFHLLTLQHQLVAEFDALQLAQLSLEEPIKIFVLAATNFPEKVDKRILLAGRIELSIEIGLPSLEERKEIILGDLLKPEDPTIDWNSFGTDFVDYLATKCEKCTPADLNKIVQEARTNSLTRARSGDDALLTESDFKFK